MNQYEGTFVSLEGIDGSGTSTLCNHLQRELDGWEFTAEPSSGKYGRLVREELQSDSDPTMSDFFLFCADRVDHIQSFLGPRLEEGTNVVTDRYNLSTFAYQAPVVREDIISRSGIEYIDTVVSEWIIEPDVVILLDLPVDEGMGRMTDGTEKYEKKDRLLEAKRIYDRFAEEYSSVVKVDATQSEEEVLSEALGIIDEVQG